MSTIRLPSRPKLRMAARSTSACVGCSLLPSPPLSTGTRLALANSATDPATVTAGTGFTAGSAPGQVSVEQKLAEDMELQIGEQLVFSIAGEEITATVSGFRRVEWDSFQPNFFMVLSPGTLADSLEVRGSRGQFMGAGVIYSEGNVLLQGEYTLRRTRSFMADTTGWYGTAGYRFGKVMPYFTLARLRVDSPLTNNTLPNSGGTAMLAQGVNMLLATGNNGQQTASVGTRYDFAKNMALKVQFDHIRLRGTGSTGFLVNVQPGFGGPVNVVSAVVDFVF